MIYRILLKVSYHEAYFDFESAEEACAFAKVALEHSANSEDQKRIAKLSIVVVNPNVEEEEED